MVFYNASTRELTAKIVYYGPGLGGKTTNLQVLHRRLEPGTAGELLALSTETDRTIYFDLLPVELGDIKGYTIRFQLATVPGQTAFNETRRVVLKGADGIVFVADSQWTMLPKNLESWQSLRENLAANDIDLATTPVVVQFNKRDLPDILSIEAMQEALGFAGYPHVEAVASEGRGVTETFKQISKLTFLDLLRRLQGRPPSETGALLGTRGIPAGPEPASAEAERRPPLTLVRPIAEPPVEPRMEAPPAHALEAPFAEHDDRPIPSDPADLAARVRALETGFEESGEAVRARLAALERRALADETAAAARETQLEQTRDFFTRSLSLLERRLEERVRALHDRLEAETSRGRGVEETLAEEFRRLKERAEKLDEQTAAFARDLEDLQHTLSERITQAPKEGDELRLQLAPLLEEQVRRETDENWTAEIERLRQALAESLEDLSERVRKAVRG